MTQPSRIQLSRRRDWRLPANAVKVDRSTPYGNPFRVRRIAILTDAADPWVVEREGDGAGLGCFATEEAARADAVARFQAWIGEPAQALLREAARAELAGRDLACWCGPDSPCHADVWLEIANQAAPQG